MNDDANAATFIAYSDDDDALCLACASAIGEAVRIVEVGRRNVVVHCAECGAAMWID
jgi:hypothetical protein